MACVSATSARNAQQQAERRAAEDHRPWPLHDQQAREQRKHDDQHDRFQQRLMDPVADAFVDRQPFEKTAVDQEAAVIEQQQGCEQDQDAPVPAGIGAHQRESRR
ncbi:hypothetical protein ACVWZK_005110 [Bradyrhizobium sp. GM0.4]